MANILIADDSTITRRGLSLILTEAGHTIAGQATTGKQAYLLYQQLKPDLVTMDITMPGMDGVEALRTILKMDPSAKIIMISALDQRKMVLEALENGASHYIIKPFKEEKVLEIIDAVLNK
ncbi:MAG TPA: response regulator [Syntrophomonadaceae bacterium]|nr:response regulator [Syntrophomonadaceae bacterium]